MYTYNVISATRKIISMMMKMVTLWNLVKKEIFKHDRNIHITISKIIVEADMIFFFFKCWNTIFLLLGQSTKEPVSLFAFHQQCQKLNSNKENNNNNFCQKSHNWYNLIKQLQASLLQHWRTKNIGYESFRKKRLVSLCILSQIMLGEIYFSFLFQKKKKRMLVFLFFFFNNFLFCFYSM